MFINEQHSSMKNISLLLTLTILFFSCTPTKNNSSTVPKSYQPVSRELYDTIATMDSIFFNAFNARNLNQLQTMLSEELEFYHDLGGVTDYVKNIENFKKSFENTRKVRRELIKGSLEVYPINNYGAVETGAHRFYATENGQEKLVSEAKFAHIWQKKDSWKITRIISYAHIEY